MNRSKKTNGVKIAYLVDFYRTENAGTERQLAHLLRRMPGLGYSVYLVSLQDSPFLKNEAGSAFAGVRIQTLAAESDLSKTPGSLMRLYRLFRKLQPDIVHTFFPTSNSIGIMIARLAGVRHLISSRRDMGYNLTGRDVALLKLANRFVSFVAVNSKMVSQRTMEMELVSCKKIRIIHNGLSALNVAAEPAEKTSERPVVGIVANLNRPVKRVDLFIKAAALVLKELPGIKFWVIGDGDLRIELETLAAELIVNSDIVFWGRRSDVPNLLTKMDVGVICSDSEGFSNSIMEYMAVGLPVVATAVGGNPELVQNGITGLLVSAGNANALADALMVLLKSPETSLRMGAAGHRAVVEQFSLEKMVQNTDAVYRGCMRA